MKHTLFTALAFLMVVVGYAQMPQMKVDISIGGRSDAETLEDGYTVWRPQQGSTTDTFEQDGIKFTFSVPEGVEYICRAGWSKTYIGNADYKAQNGRLTFDGLSLDPSTECGEMILTIEGLPKGNHILQTYHNRWENPDNFNGWPMTVKVNGELVHSKMETTFLQSVSANACLLSTPISIEKDGDKVVISFYTSEEDKPASMSKAKDNKAPVINGFELNTTNIKKQAKEPYPASGDLHVDCSNDTGVGYCNLTWTAADESVVKHLIFVGTDSLAVDNATVPTAETTATEYHLSDTYSMNTYYWRVDEVDNNGQTTKGNVWMFRPRQLAFPGAEGYGRYAIGGRGGVVYHVTNLKNDMEPGSFLYGLTGLTGPRTIVFDVSGIITMSENPEVDMPSVFSNPFITIAAQTAPGKGICLRYCNLGIGKENIVRHLRAKRGYGADGVSGNALGLNTDNSIIDHTTAAWGTDETFSTRGAKMITFQYSMIAEALGITAHKNYSANTNHGYAATIDGKIGTYSHNLLVNCAGRNWSMGGGMDGSNTAIGQMDIFNNVVYNWKSRTTDGGCHEVNFVNNYYKMGADTSLKTLFTQQYENVGSAESKWQAYISGNIRENKDHTLSEDKYGDTYRYTLSNGAIDPNTRTDQYAYRTFVDAPFFPSYAEIHSAKDAFKIVTSTAGATMPCRDNQHKRLVRETIDGTWTYVGSKSGIKGQLDREFDTDEANQGFEVWPEESRPADFDTDGDGIPNWYENITGSNPDVASNNDDPDRDGWTLLEDYLDFMAHPYIILAPDASAPFDVSGEFCGFTNAPQFSVTSDSDLFTASTSGSAVIDIKAGNKTGIGHISVTVTDAEGSTYTQRFGVAVSGDATGISSVRDDNYKVASRQFFTIDGQSVNDLMPHGIYIMKETDTQGNTHTSKVMRNE